MFRSIVDKNDVPPARWKEAFLAEFSIGLTIISSAPEFKDFSLKIDKNKLLATMKSFTKNYQISALDFAWAESYIDEILPSTQANLLVIYGNGERAFCRAICGNAENFRELCERNPEFAMFYDSFVKAVCAFPQKNS